MKKKLYIFPIVEVALLCTKELMKTEGTSPDLPPDPGGNSALRKRTEVF